MREGEGEKRRELDGKGVIQKIIKGTILSDIV